MIFNPKLYRGAFMRKTFIYEGKETNYEIDSIGEIYNKKTGKKLRGTYARNDYHSVQLTIEGKIKTFMTHRLVALMFCDNPNHYNIVDHINRNKLDNRAENLRWVDNSTNMKNRENKTQTTVTLSDKANLVLGNWLPLKINDNYYISDNGELAKKSTLTILKGTLRNGYRRYTIGGKMYSAHVLVYQTFIGEIPEGYVIDHIDGDKLNNNISNLRAVTQSKNVKNAYQNGHKGQVEVTAFTPDGIELQTFPTIQAAADFYKSTYAAINAASRYGTKSKGVYWYRNNCINTKQDFITPMPNVATPYNNMAKTYFVNNKFYSVITKHLIPSFNDENGNYVYLSQADGTYVKTYFNPCNLSNCGVTLEPLLPN